MLLHIELYVIVRFRYWCFWFCMISSVTSWCYFVFALIISDLLFECHTFYIIKKNYTRNPKLYSRFHAKLGESLCTRCNSETVTLLLFISLTNNRNEFHSKMNYSAGDCFVYPSLWWLTVTSLVDVMDCWSVLSKSVNVMAALKPAI